MNQQDQYPPLTPRKPDTVDQANEWRWVMVLITAGTLFFTLFWAGVFR